MCRGNAMGKWMASGNYERIAGVLSTRLEADAFFLEYDSERAGGFEPLRFSAEAQEGGSGLGVDKSSRLENKDFLRRGSTRQRSTFPSKTWQSLRNAASRATRAAAL